MLDRAGRGVEERFAESLVDHVAIVRMNGGQEVVAIDACRVRVRFEDPADFLGPGDRGRGQVGVPAPDFGHLLRDEKTGPFDGQVVRQLPLFFLARFQLFRGALAIRDVGDAADVADQRAGGVADLKPARADPANFSVGTHDSIFDVETRPVAGELGEGRAHAFSILRNDEGGPLVRVGVQRLPRASPDPLEGGADVVHLPHVGRADPEGVADVVGQLMEVLMALPKLVLCQPALGDVLDVGDEVERDPKSIAHERGAEQRGDDFAALVDVALFDLKRMRAAIDGAFHVFRAEPDVVRMGEVVDGAGEQLGLRIAEQRAERAVHAEPAQAVGGDQRNADRCLLECAGEALFALQQYLLALPALRDVLVHDDRAGMVVGEGTDRQQEPALFPRRRQEVLDGEGLQLAVQDGANAGRDLMGLVRAFSDGVVADRQVVAAHSCSGILHGVRRSEAPPGVIDRDDRTGFVEQGDVRGQGVENPRLSGVLAASKLFLARLKTKVRPVLSTTVSTSPKVSSSSRRSASCRSGDEKVHLLGHVASRGQLLGGHVVPCSIPSAWSTGSVWLSVPTIFRTGRGQSFTSVGVIRIPLSSARSGSRSTFTTSIWWRSAR